MNTDIETASAWAGGEGGEGGCCGGGVGEGPDGPVGGGEPPYVPPVPPSPPPVCNFLKANGQAGILTLPVGGGSVNLTWASTLATGATLTPTGAAVAVNGSKTVNVTADATYMFVVTNAVGSDSCSVSIDVLAQTLPTCDSFTASPTSHPYGGGASTLTWATTNADTVSIDNGVGVVVADGTQSVNVTNDITYTMTVSAAGYADAICPVSITVGAPQVISCANNVTFTANDYSLPQGGGDVTLDWSTTGIDSLSINGVTSTNLSGSELVSVGSDTTYTLTAVAGSTTINCPLTIDVASGGGGGGSSSPSCDLDISDEKIKAGEEVTLTWNTSRASEIKITDNHGNVLIDSDDKDDLDGKMTIKPTKDTEYTLLSKKGSRERKCKVEVDVTNNITVFSSRTQDPRVAGISLTQVPYTGFEAGPALTMIFYALLTIWGLFVAYIFAVRRDFIGGISLAGAHSHVPYVDMSTAEAVDDPEAETKAESYVHAVAHTEAPVNLPIAPVAPIIGYASVQETDEIDESIEMTELENRAHAQKVLLSSDAMRFFMNATEAGEIRNEKLDAVILQAKASFPTEGGWVALNLARIETLITDDQAAEEVENESEVITGGSLAEAIVSGNVIASYQLIAHRPMIALADAASELDAVYRSRKGEKVHVSNMLATSSTSVSTESLKSAIMALTGALDGTYDSEEEAVKMAIMKAVKATS